MISMRFNKPLIETLRRTIRFREPYGVFIDALGYMDFNVTKNLFFYNDGSKPWESERHYTEYYETLHNF